MDKKKFKQFYFEKDLKQHLKYFFIISLNLISVVIFLDVKKKLPNIEYLFFSFITLFYVNYTIYYWKYFVEIYLCFLIYLGFWFDLSISIFFADFNVSFIETNIYLLEQGQADKFSRVLNKISLALIVTYLTVIFIKKIQNNSYKLYKNKKFDLKHLRNFFNLHAKLCLKIFLFFFLLIIIINYYFDITHFGKSNGNYFLQKFFNVFFIILFPLTFALILDFLSNNFKVKKFFFFITIFSTILLATLLLSRAAIINILPLIFIYFLYKKVISIHRIILIIIFFSFALFSLNLVNNLRENKNFFHFNFTKFKNDMTYLINNRWVGIDGMINVEYTENKSFKKMKEGFLDKDLYYNYYEKNFFYSQDENKKNFLSTDDYMSKNNKNLKSVIVPGYMAFFNTAGSTSLFFFLNFLLICLLLFFEFSFWLFIKKRGFLLSLSSFILTWRIIHSGLYVQNTLIYLLIMFLYLVFLRYINLYLNVFSKKN